MSNYLIVARDLHRWGGMDRANYELARFLADTGHSVEIVACSMAVELEQHPAVTWHRVAERGPVSQVTELVLSRAGRVRVGRSDRATRVVVNGGNCPVDAVNWVHSVHHAWRPHAQAAGRAEQLRIDLGARLARSQEQKAFHLARLVIGNSERTRTALLDELRLEPSRVRTVYLGADPWQPRRTETEKAFARRSLGWREERGVALFVGGIGHDRRKGFDVAFAAWVELCRDPAWDLDLVALGAGREIGYWRRRAGQAGLSDRVRFCGFTHDVASYFDAADVMVAPTRYEPYGLAVQEALCREIPAFVTSSAGIAERFPATLDELVLHDPPLPSDLVNRLQHWRRHPDALGNHLRSFGQELGQWSWQDMAREMQASIDATYATA